MGRLKNKVALITGASNGLGRAIAEQFAKEGAELFLTYKSDRDAIEEVKKIVEAYGVRCHIEKVDFNCGDVSALVSSVYEAYEKVNILVNNVGITTRDNFLDITDETYDLVLDCNLKFPFFLTQKITSKMIKDLTKGSIISISSISAFKAISHMAHYQASKAALSMFSKSIALELAPYDIRSNIISPGLTASKGNRSQWRDNPQVWGERGKSIPLKRPGTPHDHAGAAVFLASDESAWMTGANLILDGGESTI